MSYFRFNLLVVYGLSFIKEYRGMPALALAFEKKGRDCT